jgi:hypothetical protein
MAIQEVQELLTELQTIRKREQEILSTLKSERDQLIDSAKMLGTIIPGKKRGRKAKATTKRAYVRKPKAESPNVRPARRDPFADLENEVEQAKPKRKYTKRAKAA